MTTETEHGILQTLGDSSFEQAIKAYSRGSRKFHDALAELANQPQEPADGSARNRREEDLG